MFLSFSSITTFYKSFFNSKRLQSYSFFIIAISIFTIFNLFTLHPGHNYGDDFAAYIRQALNILHHKPLNATIGAMPPPPGFSVILLPWVALFGLNFQWLKSVNIPFWALFSVLSYRYFLQQFPYPVAALAGLALLFSPIFLLLKQNIGADIPFAALALACLTLYNFAMNALHQDFIRKFWSYWLALLVCLIIVLYVKSAGIVVPAAIIGAQIVVLWFSPISSSKKATLVKAASAVLFCTILTVSLQIFWDSKVLGSSTLNLYLDTMLHEKTAFSLLDWLNQRYDRVLYEIVQLGFIFFPARIYLNYISYSPLIAGILLSICIGFLIHILKMRKVSRMATTSTNGYGYEWYFIGLLTLIILWPAPGGPRYLLPLTPFFLTYALHAIGTLSAKIPFLSVRKGQLGFLVVFLGYILVSTFALKDVNDNQLDELPYKKLVEWVNKNTQPDTSLFITFHPRLISLMTDRTAYHRNAIVKYLEKNHQFPPHYLEHFRIAFIVVDNEKLDKILAQNPSFILVWTFPPITIYRNTLIP